MNRNHRGTHSTPFRFSFHRNSNSNFSPRRQTGNRFEKERFPGDLAKIDLDVKFIEGQQVDGVHLVTDLDKAKELQALMGTYTRGSKDFFPAMFPVSLCTNNMHKLESEPYVMAPKPAGPRFLLYVDSSGRIYLENMTQHFFIVDEDLKVNMSSYDGHYTADTLLDGVVTRKKSRVSGETNELGELTYVIQDAIRCNGKDLVDMGIIQRILYVKDEIMNPRTFRSKQGIVEKEAFQLDIADFKDTCYAEELLSSEFQENFDYPIRSFEFLPRKMGYISNAPRINGKCIQWAENDQQECSFRLKILKETGGNEGGLMASGPGNRPIQFDKILLTDEIRKYDGQIIDCCYTDHQWVFHKLRLDRKHPNGLRSITEKMNARENAVSRERLLTSLEKR